MFCFAAPAYAANLWGTVVWKTGSPAVGIELRLKKRGSVLPVRIFTNSVGRYGLYNLSPNTTEYSLQVLRSNVVVKEVKLPQLNNNARIPDIAMP
jgi:hypothetical protein